MICDWTNKKNCLFRYRMLNFFARHGMIMDKIHEKISFEQSMCLERYINFNPQRERKIKMNLRKTSINYILNYFMEKQWKTYEVV